MSIKKKRKKEYKINVLYQRRADPCYRYCLYCKKEITNLPYYTVSTFIDYIYTILYFCSARCHDLMYLIKDGRYEKFKY